MKRFHILIIIIVMVGCVGCAVAEPAPVETLTPTETTSYIATPEFNTPVPTITVPPSATVTVRSTSTITITQSSGETPDVNQDNYDFSKYGPLASIVYIGTSDTLGIRLINPDGSMVDWEFIADKDFFINEIAWSLDGSKIVLTSDNGIYLLLIEDKALIHLPATTDFSIISSPSFSPDGKFVTFFAYNEGAIFRINSDGTGLVNLTPDARYRNSFESPSWTPSGAQIVYSRPYADGMLYLMNPDGTGSRKLVETGWNDRPRYSPDGKWLAFIRYDGSQGFLYAMPVEGGTYRLLTGNDDDVRFFSWSPDGRFLVWDSNVGNWIVEFESGKTWQLETIAAVYGGVGWSPIMKTAETREDCIDGWSRLEIGKLVQLIGNEPNRVRKEPQKGDNVVGQFVADETYILLDGPVCAERLVWWEIADPRLPGGSGWTAEGDCQDYWLEPVNP